MCAPAESLARGTFKGFDLEICRAPRDKAERPLTCSTGLATAFRIFGRDHREAVSRQNLHMAGNSFLATGNESPSMHPSDGWLWHVRSLLRVEIKDFILRRVYDVTPRDVSRRDMLFK